MKRYDWVVNIWRSGLLRCARNDVPALTVGLLGAGALVATVGAARPPDGHVATSDRRVATCPYSGPAGLAPLSPLASPLAPRLPQGRPFWFTLGAHDDSPAHVRTRAKVAIADASPIHCAIAEWGYSFHHLKDGQADGAGQKHYGGYPTPPQSRAEAMAVVRRYYLRLRDIALEKATPEQRRCFIAINGHYCYQHYACEWGCDVVGSEVGENINSIQAHIAFTRGAARQYAKPWLMDFSPWYGPSIFDENPERIWGDNSGPTHGHSLSLMMRTFYASYMAGATVVVAEGGALNAFRSRTPDADGTLPLSSLGRECARFYRFTRRHPDRGVPYVPVALVLPFDHGIFPGFLPKQTWNAFDYRPGDQRILDALNAFFPGSLGDPDQRERPDRQPGDPAWKDPEYMRTEALRMVASPHGDIVDVLLDNAPSDVLRSYPAIVLAGEFTADTALRDRLTGYVRSGGQVVTDTVVLRSGVLPIVAGLKAPSDRAPLTSARLGRGTITVVGDHSPEQATAARPISAALRQLRRRLVPFDVSSVSASAHAAGRIQTLFNRTPDGWIVTLINNEGITKTFRASPKVDPRAEQRVTIRYRGPGRVARAILWGEEADTVLPVSDIGVTVPPGDVRVVRLVTSIRAEAPGR